MSLNVRQFVRRPLRKLGYDFRKITEKPELIDFLQSRSVDLVLDVGANSGQFARLMRDRGYAGEIISYEPVSEVFEMLMSHAAADRKWQVHNIALGSNPGTAVINVSSRTEFSSIKSVSRAAIDFDEFAKPVRQEEVRVETIDNLWNPEWERRNVFLKVDTQGYEQQILAGATNTLSKLTGVQLELPVVRLYEGIWHLDEAIHFMRTAGFVPAQINAGNYHLSDTSSVLEVDCIFRKFDASVDV
jgi:FkbM family methyltransferase